MLTCGLCREKGAVKTLVSCLRDVDADTRKFAAFAMGNLAFHSDFFYDEIAGSVGLLADLLDDSASKTRANAAGLEREGGLVSVSLAHPCAAG